MAVTAKCTFSLRYQQAGDSFTLYNIAPSLDALGVQNGNALSPVDRLWRAFLPLLGSGVQAPNVRISDEALRGDSLPFDRTYVVVSATNPAPPVGINVIEVKAILDDSPDFYDTGALVVLAASNTQKGRMTMRFIPDQIINYPVGLNPDRNWDKQFERFEKQLIADKWCIKSLADANVNPPQAIQTVTRTAVNTNLLVTFFANHGMNAKDTIRLSRVKGTPSINAVYTVDSAPSATTLLLANTSGTQLTGWTLGSARKLLVTYPAITKAFYRYVTRRKAGRPFGTPVGRRKRVSTSR